MKGTKNLSISYLRYWLLVLVINLILLVFYVDYGFRFLLSFVL